MAISDDKQYEEIRTHLRYLNDKMIEAFNLFIKLATAIVGGTFFLHWKLAANDPQRTTFARGTDALLLLAAVGMTIIILNNLRAWYSYRGTLSHLFPEISHKTRFWSWLTEVLMCVMMLGVAWGFCAHNPLSTR
jgi:hypothetical protein